MRLPPRLVRFFPPPPGLVSAAGSARLLAASLLLAFGCAHPAANAPPSSTATLRIRNLSDFEWTVALETVSGQYATDSPWAISPRGERTIVVPAGEYRLRSTLDGAKPDAGAGETVRLLAGRIYTWPLATLLSEPEEPAP